MRRLWLSLAAVGFGLMLVVVSAVKVSRAAEEEMSGASPTPEPVNYYLPYPGILPDHPLYALKMVRDRIVLWLAMDPVIKAEKLLLYADKRVNAAWELAKGNQPELAVATAQKAEKYLEEAVAQVEMAAQQGRKVEELSERLRLATAKHQEVLGEVLSRVPEQARGGLEQALQMSKRGQERVMQRLGR